MSARARTAEPPSAWPPASQGGRKAARKGERPPWWSRRCESGKVPVSGATEGTRLSLSTLSRRRPPQTYHRPRIAADAPRRTPPLRPPIRLGDGRTPPLRVRGCTRPPHSRRLVAVRGGAAPARGCRHTERARATSIQRARPLRMCSTVHGCYGRAARAACSREQWPGAGVRQAAESLGAGTA